MRMFLLTGMIALGLSVAIDTAAEANDRSVRAVMIPAMACQPLPGSGAELNIPHWVARAGASAVLVCPVQFNNIELGTTSADNDITSFRVHYDDSDGSGSANAVAVDFYQYGGSLKTPTVLCSATLTPSTTALTSTTVPCVHDVASSGKFYGFLVRLTSAPNGVVFFRGIDFP